MKPSELPTGEEGLRQKLTEVRRSRKAAERKGAYTSVGSMHRLEVDIVKELNRIEAERAAETARREEMDRLAKDPAALASVVADAWADMPEAQRAQLRPIFGNPN